jgi:putative transposase
MTFHSNANLPHSAGQGRPEAPEDLLRAMVQRLVQETLQAEFDQFIGAGPFERGPDRRGWRNGYKPRTLKTRVGKLVLRIPQDREGRFQPSIFERYERSEKALVAAMIEMYVQGVSTRKVSKIVEQLCGHLISASAVSAVTRKLDEEVGAWRRRSLAGKRYRYLVIDAHYEQLRREGSVRSTAVLWVVGIDEDGYREHLGLWTGSAESLETWGAVFRDLVDRGVAGVEMTISDEHLGLVQALRRYFPHAAHQRCTVHYLRNALGTCSRTPHLGALGTSSFTHQPLTGEAEVPPLRVDPRHGAVHGQAHAGADHGWCADGSEGGVDPPDRAAASGDRGCASVPAAAASRAARPRRPLVAGDGR